MMTTHNVLSCCESCKDLFFSEDSYSTRVKASTALTIFHLLVKEGSTSRGIADLD